MRLLWLRLLWLRLPWVYLLRVRPLWVFRLLVLRLLSPSSPVFVPLRLPLAGSLPPMVLFLVLLLSRRPSCSAKRPTRVKARRAASSASARQASSGSAPRRTRRLPSVPARSPS
jgi:hypothetical protein